MATAFMEPGAGARGGAGTPGGTLGFNYDQLEGDVGRCGGGAVRSGAGSWGGAEEGEWRGKGRRVC